MTHRPLFVALLGALSPLAAAAHEGHGLPGSSHWHASDVLGWLAVAVAIGVAWAISRRK